MTGYKLIYFDHTEELPDLQSLIDYLQDEEAIIANCNDDLIAIHPDAFDSFSECFYSNEDEHD